MKILRATLGILLFVIAGGNASAQVTADLSISVEIPAQIRVGEIATLLVTMRNLTSTGTSADLIARFPGGGGPTSLLPITADNEPPTCVVERDHVGCRPLFLAGGETKTVRIRVLPRQTGAHEFIASISGEANDPNRGDNTVRGTISPVGSSKFADLRLRSEVPVRIPFDQKVQQRITIENLGPDVAAGAILRIWKFEARKTLLEAPGGCSSNGNIIVCQIGAIAVGESKSLVVEYSSSSLPPPFALETEVVPLLAQDGSHAIVHNAAGAGVAADFETILIPVGDVGAGALGSVWRTELWYASDTGIAHTVPNLYACQITCPPPPDARLGVRIYSLLNHPYGGLLHVDRRVVEGMHFNLRAFDTSQSTRNFGTTIPVVRERDLETERLVLQSVPVDSNFRATLRLYDADARPNVNLKVRFYEMGSSTLIAETTVPLSASVERDFQISLPLQPGFAMIDNIVARFPELGNIRSGRLLVEVTSNTPGTRFWAFVSVTNNETQHVTVITPR